MEFIWLGIAIILAVIELSTVSLVTVWFIASALITLVVSIFIDSILIQVAVFVILGTILLITTRAKLVSMLSKTKEKTNTDRIIGMSGIVTQRITKNKSGEVKVDGKRWTAIAQDTIEEDSIVKILKIDGVKVIVEKE